MSNKPKVARPSKKKLLDLLKKHSYIKQDAAKTVGVDEKTVRRWCRDYEIDTEIEKKRDLVLNDPVSLWKKRPQKNDPLGSGVVEVKVKNDGKTVTRKVFVFSDMQIPYHNKRALSIALQRCKDYLGDKNFKGERYVIIIGDFMDYEPLLGKARRRYPVLQTEELRSLELEFIEAAKVLSQIESVIPKDCTKVFLKGNHEDRADQMIGKPDGQYWKKHLDIDDRLGLSERGWKVITYNQSFKIGHLHYTHGSFFNQHHAFKHAQHWGKNVMYGHTHQIQMYTMPSPVKELPVWAASIGCLSDRAPEWQRNKPNAYDHAFAEVDYVGDDFFPSIRRIIRGKLAIPGGTVYLA